MVVKIRVQDGSSIILHLDAQLRQMFLSAERRRDLFPLEFQHLIDVPLRLATLLNDTSLHIPLFRFDR